MALLAMATAAIANWTGNLGKIIEFVKKYLLPSQSKVTDEQRRDLLKQLNKVVLEPQIAPIGSCCKSWLF